MRLPNGWPHTGALVAVPTLIAGVYGMNFQNMPELGWFWGYPFAIAVMLTPAVLPMYVTHGVTRRQFAAGGVVIVSAGALAVAAVVALTAVNYLGVKKTAALTKVIVALVIAVFEMQHSGDGKSSMIWLVLAYFFHTTGELCISPVGLSMVTKLAPMRLGSLMMGVWFLVNLVGNTLAGYIGAFTENMGEYGWVTALAADFGVRPEHAGLLGVFGGLVVVLLFFSVVLWAISGRVVDWMHGAETVKH